MEKYFGPIKTKTQAHEIATELEKRTDQKSLDCAKMLRRDWESIASRPFIAAEVIALLNTKSLSVDRPKSVMAGILKK